MDPASSIPKVPKSIPVPEHKENPFDKPYQHKEQEKLDKKKKADSEQHEHHGGNDPELGHIIDVDA